MKEEKIKAIIEQKIKDYLPNPRFQISSSLLHKGAVEFVESESHERDHFIDLMSFRLETRSDYPEPFIEAMKHIIEAIKENGKKNQLELAVFNIGDNLFQLILDSDNTPMGILDHTMLARTKEWIAAHRKKRKI